MDFLSEVRKGYPNIITPDSKRGRKLGFTLDKFEGYLSAHEGNDIISLTVIKPTHGGRNNVIDLLDKLRKSGFSIDAVSVSSQVKSILLTYGFHECKAKDYLLYLNPNIYTEFERKVIYSRL